MSYMYSVKFNYEVGAQGCSISLKSVFYQTGVYNHGQIKASSTSSSHYIEDAIYICSLS